MLPMSRKVFWITGGGSGIGSQLSIKLAAQGHTVIISGRTKSKLQNIAKPYKNIIPMSGDVSKESDCKKISTQIMKKFKKIDVVMLNAATYNPGPIEKINIKEIKNVVDVNLIGVFNCLSVVLNHMKEEKMGHLVFISSPAGFTGLPGAGIYGVTKSALTFLAETLNIELKKFNIKVQVVHPGFVKTPMTDKNSFTMPFLISADNAAKRIMKKLDTNDFEIYFPKRLILIMKFLRFFPYSLYFKIINKFVKLS